MGVATSMVRGTVLSKLGQILTCGSAGTFDAALVESPAVEFDHLRFGDFLERHGRFLRVWGWGLLGRVLARALGADGVKAHVAAVLGAVLHGARRG